MKLSTMFKYDIIVTLLVFSNEVNSDSPCREHYGLQNVCWETGDRYAFHCLVQQSSKNVYYSVQQKDQNQIDIIWHDDKIQIENEEDKYSVETTKVNSSYRCISLFIYVDHADDGSYYRCGADDQDFPEYAQLFLSNFASIDEKGLRGKLDVDERMLNNISIVATVSHYNGIPGLEVNLYINEDLVAHSPKTLSCQPEDKYELRYYYDVTDPVIDYMVMRLTYTHSDLPREVQLASHSHRFNNKQVEEDENVITPRGHINIQNIGGSLVRVTGVVWNVPAEDVSIFVSGEVISSKAKTYKDGQIEISGDFDTDDTEVGVEIVRIELVYKNHNENEYGVLSTVHFSLPRTSSHFLWSTVVLAIIGVPAICFILFILIRWRVQRHKQKKNKQEPESKTLIKQDKIELDFLVEGKTEVRQRSPKNSEK